MIVPFDLFCPFVGFVFNDSRTDADVTRDICDANEDTDARTSKTSNNGGTKITEIASGLLVFSVIPVKRQARVSNGRGGLVRRSCTGVRYYRLRIQSASCVLSTIQWIFSLTHRSHKIEAITITAIITGVIHAIFNFMYVHVKLKFGTDVNWKNQNFKIRKLKQFPGKSHTEKNVGWINVITNEPSVSFERQLKHVRCLVYCQINSTKLCSTWNTEIRVPRLYPEIQFSRSIRLFREIITKTTHRCIDIYPTVQWDNFYISVTLYFRKLSGYLDFGLLRLFRKLFPF